MNYPWGYTDNGGGEDNFWANFRWEFDDVELIWMRHADRNDVIFGGRDWIGNNLSIDLKPAFEQSTQPASLQITSPGVFDIGVPVHLELKLENISDRPIEVFDRLQPEEGLLRVVIERPDGEIVNFVPPLRRLMTPPEPTEVAPGESTFASIGLSFGSKGHQFAQPGEYLITVFFPCFPLGFVATATHRIRIAHPLTRGSEELAHLLTSQEAAQFLYYGGSRRNPEVTERLMEATERYVESDPVAVRHIAAALGRNAARIHKRVEMKKGKRVIVASPADPDLAVKQLKVAMSPLPGEYRLMSAFDPLTEARLVGQLADGYLELGKSKDATSVLDDTAKRLKQEGGPAVAIDELQRRSKSLKGKQSNKT